MKDDAKHIYRVVGRKEEAPGVITLQLDRGDGAVPEWRAGQFITVYFPELHTPEGKAYSISSSPLEKHLSITVKAMGEFSNGIHRLKIGDALSASDPYGFFYSESEDASLVMVAAGIGIAPFRSLIHESLSSNPDRKLVLYYCNRTLKDVVFKGELDRLTQGHLNFEVVYHLTREADVPLGMRGGRIAAAEIAKRSRGLSHPEFFLCGSISFIRDLWNGLRASGIPEESIYTEAFFSH